MESKSRWMDAAFALDELHSDPNFREMASLIDDLQRRRVLPPSSMPDAETMSAFLNEMELLEAAELKQQPVPTERKKKMSSTERRKRDRLQLLDSVEQLQCQLESLKTEQQSAQQELQTQHTGLFDTEQKLRDNFQIQHAVAREADRVSQANMLLQQMSNPLKNLTYTDANPELQNDPMQDEAIYAGLQRNVSENHAFLAQEWESGCIPVATDEAMESSASPDGTVLSFKSARFLPFTVQSVSDTIWRVAKTGLQSGSCKSIFHLDSDTIGIKEQLVVHSAGHSEIALCVRVAIRRTLKESHVMFVWETVCDWSTPSNTQTSRTQESGWLVVQPFNTAANCSSSPVSVVQSIVKMTLVESSIAWAHLMHNSGVMLPMIVPSSYQVMLSRIQHVENCLLDDAHARS